ncbi:MAG: nitroreductase family protein [Planctomycetes bacterium]|nr:nitroreductase family protein [Planctomycetota bacterium]
MDFQTVLRTRRNIREFAAKTIPEDVLKRILEAARLAPSACNFQPWRFVVVQDVTTRTRIAQLAHDQTWIGHVCCA